MKEGQSRNDFSPVEIRLALRTLCLDDLGRKTTPDWERALQLATWYLAPVWKVSPFDHTVLNELWKILGEAGRADRIMALYEEGKRQRGVQFGRQVVERVVKSLFAAGYHQEVVDLVDEAQENGWEVELFDEVIQSQVRGLDANVWITGVLVLYRFSSKLPFLEDEGSPESNSLATQFWNTYSGKQVISQTLLASNINGLLRSRCTMLASS